MEIRAVSRLSRLGVQVYCHICDGFLPVKRNATCAEVAGIVIPVPLADDGTLFDQPPF